MRVRAEALTAAVSEVARKRETKEEAKPAKDKPTKSAVEAEPRKVEPSQVEEVVPALSGLRYKKKEAKALVEKAREKGAGGSAEEVLKAVFK